MVCLWDRGLESKRPSLRRCITGTCAIRTRSSSLELPLGKLAVADKQIMRGYCLSALSTDDTRIQPETMYSHDRPTPFNHAFSPRQGSAARVDFRVRAEYSRATSGAGGVAQATLEGDSSHRVVFHKISPLFAYSQHRICRYHLKMLVDLKSVPLLVPLPRGRSGSERPLVVRFFNSLKLMAINQKTCGSIEDLF